MNPLPHPLTGELFDSPVRPGRGWPGDPATARTPIARTPEDVESLSAGAKLPQLDARISVCRACPRLVQWREEVALTKRASFAAEPYWGRPVAGFGPVPAGVLVVGLAPAANGANRTGRVFTGDKSGDWLFASLHRVGLANQATATHAGDGLELIDTRIIATVRCAPPANKPTPQERDTCSPWLHRELELLLPKAKVIVPLGSFGWDATLRALRELGAGVSPKPRFGHGVEVRVGALTLLGCYHPSQHNTFTGRLTEEMTDRVMARARELAGH